MAAYTGTPTILRKWEVASRFGQQVEFSKDVSLTLVAQGGAANTIGKVALGFASIYSVLCILFTDGGAVKRTINLFTDGTNVYTADPTVATDANRGAAADVTGTLVMRITGKP